jgi:catechol 2,3-dioxygenase-like lactoylglutathione lyase family enzyme
MPRIRHIAILANDTAALAAFYTTAFGMAEVSRQGEAVFLSDGHINLAVLPARGRPEGMFHFGFEVDDLEGTARGAVAAGARAPETVPRDGRFAEAFITDPVGTRVDLSEAGWKLA